MNKPKMTTKMTASLLSFFLWGWLLTPVALTPVAYAFVDTVATSHVCQRQLDVDACLNAISVDELDGLGLLRGVDVTKHRYYASRLAADSKDDLAWFAHPGLAW